MLLPHQDSTGIQLATKVGDTLLRGKYVPEFNINPRNINPILCSHLLPTGTLHGIRDEGFIKDYLVQLRRQQ